MAVIVGESPVKVNELRRSIRRLAIDSEIDIHDDKTLMDLFFDKVLDHYLILEYGRRNGIFLAKDEWESAVQTVRRDYPEGEFQRVLLRGYIDLEEWKNAVKEQVLIEKILSKVASTLTQPSHDDIKAYYKAHLEEFKHPKRVRFRQIVTRNRDEAKDLKKRLTRGEDFEQLAMNHSIAPEAKKGGRVGWIAEGELESVMEKVLFSLRIGKISPIVTTEYGYHIFEVLEKQPAGLQELADVARNIQSSLYLDRRRLYLEEWLKGLRKQTPVKLNEAVLEKIQIG